MPAPALAVPAVAERRNENSREIIHLKSPHYCVLQHGDTIGRFSVNSTPFQKADGAVS
ncbi:MAG TPA: hypothetical protein VFO57_00735 [Burkholderiales bacterium]|nr:hypothetical protein [Burkholderiales bacterium]